MRIKRVLFNFIILIIALACAAYALKFRVALEQGDKSVAIIADYREVLNLALGANVSVEDALKTLINNGLSGLMVSELTGDDSNNGIGYAELKSSLNGTAGTIISIMPGSPYADILNSWLKARFNIVNNDNNMAVHLPFPVNMFKTVGIVPDIDGLELAKKLNLKIFYRPAQSFGWMAENASLMLEKVNASYDIGAFAPAGEIVSGWPDVSVMADTAHKLKLPLALVEFSRQVGAPALNHKASPYLIPLHSVTNEEMTARNITRKALRERLIRAAVERSVRLLLLRTPPANTAEYNLNDYTNEVKLLAQGLTRINNFKMAWPKANFADLNLNFKLNNILAAWALSSVFILSLYMFILRIKFAPMPDKLNILFIAKFIIISGLLAFLISKSNSTARLTGAFAAPFIVTEASLAALDFNNKFLTRLFKALLIALAGGLAVASFFSVPSYMLRLQTFSGVKLTLMLPPLLVLIHDLRKRVHPESLYTIMSRPPLWGELALCGVLLLGLGIMLFRSGNVSFIPGFEARIRESLERLLIARPRSKEVFLGWPCLLLLGFLVKNNLWARYREVLRIGVALGFSSIVNSFCHFHTPLLLILLREFNGLWTGLLLGLIITLGVKFILLPLLKFIKPLFI
ncbi:MAG: hypothetical protein IJQ29_09970 [Synergistaceae bacterium]|nr:hypothetical protein [Synergistaceae bacterium]